MFKTPLVMEQKIGAGGKPSHKGRIYYLVENLIWHSPITGADITVPVGFHFDGASVPRAAWWFCSPFAGRHARAACLHDWLCETSDDQRKTDKLFFEAMKSDGVDLFKRFVMFKAVKAYQKLKGKY